MTRRVLITGGLGFVGSNLTHELVKRGDKVTVVDNSDPTCGGDLRNLDPIAGEVELIAGDLRDADAMATVVRGKDLVLHCAAKTSHVESMQRPFDNLDVNARGTLTLLEAIRQHQPAAKVVTIGTSTQTGRAVAPEVTELHPEFPLDIYSANKTIAEKYTLLYGSAHGLRTTVVRLANNFGPRAHIRTASFGFVNYFIGLALRGKEVTVYGTGSQLRNISYIQDSVEAILAAADQDAANGDVFFAVADQQVSVGSIAIAITASLGGTVRSIPWPAERAAIEVGDAVIRNTKIRERLGWRPQFTLDAGLQATRDFYAPRLEIYL
jgi:UDP-glucose 4-epimerase